MADKKDRKIKELVEAILSKQGKNYDEWIYKKHLEFLAENSDTVLSALNERNQ